MHMVYLFPLIFSLITILYHFLSPFSFSWTNMYFILLFLVPVTSQVTQKSFTIDEVFSF